MSTSNDSVDLMAELWKIEGLHLVAMRTGLPSDWSAYREAKAEVDRRMAPRVVVLGRRDVKGVAA